MRPTSWLFAAVAFTACSLAAGDEWLAPPVHLQREIAGCEEHVYRIRLASGETLRGYAEQEGVDIAVTLFRDPGSVVSMADSRNNEHGREPFLAVADEPADYRLVIRRSERTGPLGRGMYDLHLSSVTPATDGDRLEAAGNELLRAGRQARLDPGLLQEALQLCEAADAVDCQAEALQSLAHHHWFSGTDMRRGRDLLRASAELRSRGADRWAEGETLNNLGIFQRWIGELLEARESFEKALPLWTLPSGETEPLILHNAAPVYWQLGEMQKALDREQRALDLWRSASHPDGMAYAYTVLGQFSLQLGDPAEARRYQTEALKIWIARQHVSGRAESTFRLGTILEFEGNRQDALERYREALELSASWNDRLGQSKALSRIGGVLASLGRFAEAERTYEEALSTMRQANYDETLVLKGLGDLAAARSQSDQAAGWYSKALDASKRSGDHSPYVETLLAVARLERDRGRFEQAQARLDEATSMIESLRLRITNPEVRASYLASRQMYYELQIDVLMHLAQRTGSAEHRAAAFEVSERARARSLLDWLTVAGVRDNAIDPALVEREEITRQRINGKATALARLKPSDRNGAAGSAFQAEIHALLSEYQQLRSRIAGAAGEPGGEALTTARIQALLDPDTLLLEYALGDERSYLWVVSQKSVATFELPARVSIDRLARRVVELLPLSYKREHAMQATLASNRLSDVILAPAAHLLKGKRLVIVADGALQFVSFPALSDQDGNPLIVGHEIVTLPSASIIAALRRPRLSGRENLELAILADPVFTIDDARLEGRTKGQPIPADLLRSASDFGPDQLQPLPHTRVEADRIAALFPEEHRLRAVGFDASRENIMQGQLESYRRIHFATHGLLNAEHPELSGVVLSLYREDGSAQDGFLRLNDIYNLRLQAELVVISACKTALGREVKREGLVGLTRGFMHSGAARVVASLWDVRDVATSELMHRFYRHMILDQLRPAEALRAAQVSMWREPRWRSPFYWGAFQLQGEWR